jgi:hypothetical protein
MYHVTFFLRNEVLPTTETSNIASLLVDIAATISIYRGIYGKNMLNGAIYNKDWKLLLIF